uniref:Uncharacterized protein n=1 Tax=Populus alba TaxID=43335 RepID=A0A4U5N8R4_POPAL|nr:hypothetical protein D5086_0000272870 [Populus alba]
MIQGVGSGALKMGAEDVVGTDAWFLNGSFLGEAETQLDETPTLASPSPYSCFSVRLSLGEESGGWPGKLMNQIRKRNQLGKNSFIADVKAGTDGDEDNKIQLNQATMQAGLDLELRLGSDPHESSTRSSHREFL